MRYNVDDPERFFAATVNLPMADSWAMQRFLAHLPAGGRVLDAGCGSGRDTVTFRALGFDGTAFDAHPVLVGMARRRLGVPAHCLTFSQVPWNRAFNGVWACASLLHLPDPVLTGTVSRLTDTLRPGGVLYASFKQGDGYRMKSDGRFFNDLTRADVADLIRRVRRLQLLETFETPDVRPGRRPFVNVLARRVDDAGN